MWRNTKLQVCLNLRFYLIFLLNICTEIFLQINIFTHKYLFLRDYVDNQLTEETTEWKENTKTSLRFSPTTSTPSTTTTNTLVSTKSTTITHLPYTTEDQTNHIVNPTIEDQTSEIPIPTIEDQTNKIPNPTIEDQTPEISISITDDQTTEIPFSSIELTTLLTTNSRAIFKPTVRSTASTKNVKDITTSSETPTTTTEKIRYIFVLKLLVKITFLKISSILNLFLFIPGK